MTRKEGTSQGGSNTTGGPINDNGRVFLSGAQPDNSFKQSAIQLVSHRQLARHGVVRAPGYCVRQVVRGIMPENEKTVTQSRQTLESIQSDFDRIALLAGEPWDHNAHYHRHLLDYIPEQCRHILEIGCGTGEFSRLLAGRAERVLAIDLSPQMIRLAKARSKLYPNIDFVMGDVMAHHLPDNQFDSIATLTTIHHLPAQAVLRKIRKALKPGGVFVCLDLYQRSNLSDWIIDSVAYPANLFLTLIKTGKPKQSREVREAYTEHGKTDTYLTLPQIKRICADILPGALVSRHLFWRYSIIWRKEIAD